MTDNVERDIARTRGELSVTLAALERKLAARTMIDEGLNMFKETLGDDYGLNRGLEVVRANPIPVALIGIGAAWLIASQTNAVDRLASDERVRAAGRRVSDMASNIGNRAGDMATSAAQRIGLGGNGTGNGADRPLGYTGNPMVDQPGGQTGSSGWVHQASGRAQGMLQSARDSGGAIVDRASDIADQVGDMFERHPLLMGAIGMLAGGIIAAFLPSTQVEDEWFGPSRDELWNQAEKAGGETVSRVRDVAMRAADAAADAAADTVRSEAGKPLAG
ncbi:MAG: DUF3618 domain-containing protein [Alphaproteobacteria bacterium]|nr:DUF3618 domain-containing protein [Alphaproteobacteria bacterium]